jgi:hypothetical protein
VPRRAELGHGVKRMQEGFLSLLQLTAWFGDRGAVCGGLRQFERVKNLSSGWEVRLNSYLPLLTSLSFYSCKQVVHYRSLPLTIGTACVLVLS